MDPESIALNVDGRLRQMIGGFGVEIVLAFPVINGELDLPVIASAGSYDRVRITPDRAFRYTVRRGASGLVVAHNHPVDSGPSEPDRAVTRRLVCAGVVLGIPLVAHVVTEPSAIHELVSGGHWARASLPPASAVAVGASRAPIRPGREAGEPAAHRAEKRGAFEGERSRLAAARFALVDDRGKR